MRANAYPDQCKNCGRSIGYFPLKDAKGNDADPPKCPYVRRAS